MKTFTKEFYNLKDRVEASIRSIMQKCGDEGGLLCFKYGSEIYDNDGHRGFLAESAYIEGDELVFADRHHEKCYAYFMYLDDLVDLQRELIEQFNLGDD